MFDANRSFQNCTVVASFSFIIGFLAPLFATETVAFAQKPISTPQPVAGFSIEPQPLGSALAEFSTQSGLQVLFPSELTEGKQSAGVTGELLPEPALRKLLEGTGLDYLVTDAGTVTLKKEVQQADSSAKQQDEVDTGQAVAPPPSGRLGPGRSGKPHHRRSSA